MLKCEAYLNVLVKGVRLANMLRQLQAAFLVSFFCISTHSVMKAKKKRLWMKNYPFGSACCWQNRFLLKISFTLTLITAKWFIDFTSLVFPSILNVKFAKIVNANKKKVFLFKSQTKQNNRKEKKKITKSLWFIKDHCKNYVKHKSDNWKSFKVKENLRKLSIGF